MTGKVADTSPDMPPICSSKVGSAADSSESRFLASGEGCGEEECVTWFTALPSFWN